MQGGMALGDALPNMSQTNVLPSCQFVNADASSNLLNCTHEHRSIWPRTVFARSRSPMRGAAVCRFATPSTTAGLWEASVSVEGLVAFVSWESRGMTAPVAPTPPRLSAVPRRWGMLCRWRAGADCKSATAKRPSPSRLLVVTLCGADCTRPTRLHTSPNHTWHSAPTPPFRRHNARFFWSHRQGSLAVQPYTTRRTRTARNYIIHILSLCPASPRILAGTHPLGPATTTSEQADKMR